MNSALSWLGEIAERFISLFPRWLIVRATDRGVAFVRGKDVKRLQPGLHLYWPFWTECEVIPTVMQTFSPAMQVLTTKDRCSVLVGCKVTYRVSSVQRALVRVHDYDEAIEEHSKGTVRNYITTRTYDELQAQAAMIDQELQAELKANLRQFGIAVQDANVTDFAKCKVVYLASEGRPPKETKE